MRKISILTLLADLIWIPAALVIAHGFHQQFGSGIGQHEPLAQYFDVLLAAALIWVGLQSRITIEGSRASWHLPTMMSQVTVASTFLVIAILATAFMAREMLSREVMLINGLLLFVGFITIRLVARWIVSLRAQYGGAKRAVILGDGHVARELASKLERHPELMLDVVGFLYPSEAGPVPVARASADGPAPMSSVDVLAALQKQGVSEVLLAQPQASHAEIKRMIAACRKIGMQVRVVPTHYELYLSRTSMVEVEGVPLVLLQEPVFSSAATAIKRIIDVAAGALLLIISGPVVIVGGLYLRIKGRRAFSHEQRCGLQGALFPMHRLAISREEPELDFFERLLALTSATELPQLVNVLRGQMSLVGPRPETPQRVKTYSEWQRQRLSVKPGITGLAQVYGLREGDSSDAKANYDLEYILNWSAGGDVSLIVQTAWTLLLRLGELWRPNSNKMGTTPATGKCHPSAMPTLQMHKAAQQTAASAAGARERSLVNADSA